MNSYPKDKTEALSDHEAPSYFWLDPGTHFTLTMVENDVISGLCTLVTQIQGAPVESQEESGEIQSLLFSHLIADNSRLVSARMSLYRLLAAILCEQRINRFCYFELPRDTTESIEKLQPTEKLLIAAAFLDHSTIRSSHVYEGLKGLIAWRNQYAHGHNPGRSAKSIHQNHTIFPDPKDFQTLADELASLKKAAMSYCNLIEWLQKNCSHPINELGPDHRDVSRFIEMLGCFSAYDEYFPPDLEGICFKYQRLSVDLKRLALLQS